MFTWLEWVAKIIEYIAKKVVDKTVDPAFEGRKRACRAFVDLFDALIGLEYLARDFLRVVERSDARRSRAVADWVRLQRSDIESASDEFLRTMDGIGKAISIYDPVLARLLCQVTFAKKVYLLTPAFAGLNERLRINVDDQGCLTYTRPDPGLIALDLDDRYAQLMAETDATLSGRMNEHLAAMVRDNAVPAVLPLSDIEHLEAFVDLTKRHLEVLRTAREAMGAFIRQEFSIEDLLFVTR